VNLDPCHGDSYRVRGQIYLAQENYNSAIVAFSQANGIDKDVASFAGNVGCAMLRLCGLYRCRESLAGV
jgi:cytochrome c-type biogenesis protein CcmH/NrfG